MPGTNRFSLVKDIHGFPLKIQHNATDDQDADEIPYSNTASGLAATDLQAALDEVAALNANVGMTDAERAKLGGMEPGATTDQTGAEIKTLYEAEADTNAFTDADHAKLDGIETAATADQSAAEILTAVKTVDGSGSGLDADLLDGNEASVFPKLAAVNEFTTSQVFRRIGAVLAIQVGSDLSASTVGQIEGIGNSDAGTKRIYSQIRTKALDDADGAEFGGMDFNCMTGGIISNLIMRIGSIGVFVGLPTGLGKGEGTFNAEEIYDDGEQIFPVSSFTVATLPANGNAGRWIHVTDETGGAVDAFDDGADWRRCTDRAVVA